MDNPHRTTPLPTPEIPPGPTGSRPGPDPVKPLGPGTLPPYGGGTQWNGPANPLPGPTHTGPSHTPLTNLDAEALRTIADTVVTGHAQRTELHDLADRIEARLTEADPSGPAAGPDPSELLEDEDGAPYPEEVQEVYRELLADRRRIRANPLAALEPDPRDDVEPYEIGASEPAALVLALLRTGAAEMIGDAHDRLWVDPAALMPAAERHGSDLVVARAGESAVWVPEGTLDRARAAVAERNLAEAEAELVAARSTIDRLTVERDAARAAVVRLERELDASEARRAGWQNLARGARAKLAALANEVATAGSRLEDPELTKLANDHGGAAA